MLPIRFPHHLRFILLCSLSLLVALSCVLYYPFTSVPAVSADGDGWYPWTAHRLFKRTPLQIPPPISGKS